MAVTAFAILSLPLSATATQIKKVDFHTLCARAEFIVEGTIADIQQESVRGLPMTAITLVFSAKDIMKKTDSLEDHISDHDGSGTYSLTIRQLGGESTRGTLVIPGMPTYERGQESILFLKHGPRGFYVIGAAQGKFNINKASGRVLQESRPSVMTATTPITLQPRMTAVTTSPEEGSDYSEFREKIMKNL